MEAFFPTVIFVGYFSKKEDVEPDEQVVFSYIENITNLNYRINQLQKQIESIKSQAGNDVQTSKAKQEPSVVELDDKYLQLKLKDDDLKIRRTSDGIKVVRICQSCGSSNLPSAMVCLECQNSLRSNQKYGC